MTNLDKREWDFDRHELYAVKYLEDRGFAVTINKRWISKDDVTIERDGVAMKTAFPLGEKHLDYKAIMPRIVKDYELYRELLTLREAGGSR